MGAYLTHPITDKISEDKSFKGMTYGASSMQGWRITQEDAHNCITDFDDETNTSMFAVYDGHGGSEVAQYCALHLPDYIKQLPEYKTGDLGLCSKTAFLKFDETLTDETVVKELKILAGDDDGGDEDESSAAPCVQSEADMLRHEADMPLDQLLSKYEHLPGQPVVRNLRKNEQFCSPVIRAKKSVFSNGEGEVGGSGSQDGVSSSDSCNNSASNTTIILNLDDKLLTNGHADNENNMNKEKEIQDSLNSKNENNNNADSLSDVNASPLVKCESASLSNDSEPSSSTDRIKSPVKKISTEPECSSTVGNSEDNRKSRGSGQSSLSSSVSSLSSVASSSSECISKATGSCSSSDSGLASSSAECSSVSGGSGCSSSSSGEVKEPASSSSSVSASSSTEGGSLTSSRSEAGGSGAGPSSSSSEAGSSGCTSSVTKTLILNIGDDDDDSEDDDEEYEDMDSEEDEEEEDEEEEGEEEGEAVEHPCMDMTNEEPGSDSGCTACLALLRGKDLMVANAGDSRCVISRAGVVVELSFDHKPEDDIERKRIEKAGGKVTADGRVNGGLNLSRAIGDHWYKRNTDLPDEEQMISASPDIQSVTLTDEDEFIVIACDGIWNYLSSQEVVDFVLERLVTEEKRKKPSLICEELFDYCLAPNTFGDGTGCDNMTCIIIVLNPDKEPTVNKIKRAADDMDSSKTDEVQINKKVKMEEASDSTVDDTVDDTVMEDKQMPCKEEVEPSETN